MHKTSDEMYDLLSSIFNYSADGICVTDKNANIIAINEASCRLFGLKREEVLGKNVKACLKLGMWSPSTALKVLELKKRVSEVEYSHRTNKHILVTGTPVFDDHGQLVLVIENERDATDLNQLKASVTASLIG